MSKVIEELKTELKTCIESSEPHAPGNGHKLDSFHAGAAALRALGLVDHVSAEMKRYEERVLAFEGVAMMVLDYARTTPAGEPICEPEADALRRLREVLEGAR